MNRTVHGVAGIVVFCLAAGAFGANLLINGEIEGSLTGWSSTVGSGEEVAYRTERPSPFGDSSGAARLTDSSQFSTTPSLQQTLTQTIATTPGEGRLLAPSVHFSFDFLLTDVEGRYWHVRLLDEADSVLVSLEVRTGPRSVVYRVTGGQAAFLKDAGGTELMLPLDTWFHFDVEIDLLGRSCSGSLLQWNGAQPAILLGTWSSPLQADASIKSILITDEDPPTDTRQNPTMYLDNVVLSVPEPAAAMATPALLALAWRRRTRKPAWPRV